MGHRNKERIDYSKFRKSEAYKLPGNTLEWSCFYDDKWLKIYISEAVGLKHSLYTMVGVNDGDDIYIRKQFDGHNNQQAASLFDKLLNMEIIFRQNLYDLGMIDD